MSGECINHDEIASSKILSETTDAVIELVKRFIGTPQPDKKYIPLNEKAFQMIIPLIPNEHHSQYRYLFELSKEFIKEPNLTLKSIKKVFLKTRSGSDIAKNEAKNAFALLEKSVAEINPNRAKYLKNKNQPDIAELEENILEFTENKEYINYVKEIQQTIIKLLTLSSGSEQEILNTIFPKLDEVSINAKSAAQPAAQPASDKPAPAPPPSAGAANPTKREERTEPVQKSEQPKLFCFFDNITVKDDTVKVKVVGNDELIIVGADDGKLPEHIASKLNEEHYDSNKRRKLKAKEEIEKSIKLYGIDRALFTTVFPMYSLMQRGGAPKEKEGEANIVKDIEDVRNLSQNIQKIPAIIEEIKNEWKTYTATVPPKNFKDPLFTNYLDRVNELLKPDSKYPEIDITKHPIKIENQTAAETATNIKYFKGNSEVENLKDILNDDNIRNIKTSALTISYKKDKEQKQPFLESDKLKKYIERATLFRESLKNLVSHVKQNLPQLHKGDNAIPEVITTFTQDTQAYIKDFDKKDTTSNTDDNKPLFLVILKEYLKKIENKFADENASAYTNEEIAKIKGYFQSESGKGLVARISDKFDKIAKEVALINSSILEQSKKYASVNKNIQINILDKLEPKKLTTNTAPFINIVEKLNVIKLKLIFDINTMSNEFMSRSVDTKGAQKGGGDGDPPQAKEPEKEEEKDSLKGKIESNRKNIDIEFINSGDQVAFKPDLDKLRNLHKELYNNMLKLKDPTQVSVMSDTTFESIFSSLYNKYIEDKTVNNKDDYTATKELIDTLNDNNLLPKKVLKVDLRDKLVFIFTSLLMRLLALYIVEIMIDRRYITVLDNAVFGFLGVYTALFVLLIIMVNVDDYKLRIIYNYVNLHSDPTNIFTYTALLWIFGAIIYFIMYNINQNIITSANSDEERAKLKYKLQVISMVIWVYVTIAVIAL